MGSPLQPKKLTIKAEETRKRLLTEIIEMIEKRGKNLIN